MAAGAFFVPLGTAAAARALERAQDLGLPAVTLASVPAGTSLAPIEAARVALYKPWTASSDEGWTRWLLEQYAFPFVNVSDADVRAGSLGTRFDVIVLPSLGTAAIVEGNRPGTMPPEYTGGIGEDGVKLLREFVEAGGTLVTLANSSRFAIDRVGLPVRDVLAGLKPEQFSCPGSILRTKVDPSDPIAFGMPADSIAVFQSDPAFEVTAGFGSSQPRVVVKYADRDVLSSGWLEGEKLVADRAAVVDVPLGRGHVVLLGFGVQERAQPHATFKLLFNTLYVGAREPVSGRRRQGGN